MLGTYHAASLFDILSQVHFIQEPAKLWSFVLEQACKTLQSEFATFFEYSEINKTLSVTAAYGVDENKLKQIPFPVGRGICGWVAQNYQPALVNDVKKDPRFNTAVDMVTGLQTKLILSVPVLAQQKMHGVVEIMNKKTGPFSPQDQEFMTHLGRQTAVAYQNLRAMMEINRTKVLLESIMQNLSGGLIAMDTANLVMLVNPAAGRLLDIDITDMMGKEAPSALSTYPWIIQTLGDTLKSQQTVSRQETHLTVKGENCRFGYSTLLISDPQKKLLGSGIIFQQLKN